MSLILDGTNGLSDVDGTAAAPAIRGTDTNTGIFFGADIIGFSEGGVEAARFDASGNLGIGLTPSAKLDVNGVVCALGGNNPTGGFNLRNVAGTITPRMTNDAGDGTVIRPGATSASVKFNDFANSAELAQITDSGNLLVGTTTSLGNYLTVGSSSVGGSSAHFNRSGDGGLVRFYRTGVEVGSISVSASATAYNTSSDYRLKNTIVPMTGALAKVALLKPVTYKWNVDGSDGQGFIAHELAEVVSGCVSGEKDAVKEEQYAITPAVMDEEGNTVTEAVMGTRTVPVYQGIDTSFLVATLTAAIQEQQALITALTTRITALEAA